MAWTKRGMAGWTRVLVVVGAVSVIAVGLRGEGSRGQQPPPGGLKSQLDEASRSGDSAKALQLSAQLVDATEAEHVDALYRSARLHARAGHREEIIDYIPKPMSERPWGPPPDQQFPKEQLDREMAAAGFKILSSYDLLPEQFFVIYGSR